MTATTDSREMAVGSNEMVAETGAGPMEELATDGNGVENGPAHGTLPWIGALPNPRIGPMVVINDGGYLVPLWTAGDLLRGCKYFWRASQA